MYLCDTFDGKAHKRHSDQIKLLSTNITSYSARATNKTAVVINSENDKSNSNANHNDNLDDNQP